MANVCRKGPQKGGKNGQDTDAIAHSKNEDALGRRHKLQQGHCDALNPLPQCSKAIQQNLWQSGGCRGRTMFARCSRRGGFWQQPPGSGRPV